jgi:two-component system OmpR family response regulator
VETRTVVIVEDDADIRSAVSAVFRSAGFVVHAFGNGVDAVEAVRSFRPEVLILDLGLPDIDGFEVARRVRLFSNVYVLMLTARQHETDVLLGLEAGADDYMTKPFRPRELRYRVEALLRRPRVRSDTVSLTASPLVPQHPVPAVDASVVAGSGAGEAPVPGVFGHNGLRLVVASRMVEVDGVGVRLTGSEFDLLHALLRSGRAVQSKEDLILVLRGGQGVTGGFGRDSDEQVVQVHIANLRRKLGDSAADPRWVETVHGFGYRLAGTAASALVKDASEGNPRNGG